MSLDQLNKITNVLSYIMTALALIVSLLVLFRQHRFSKEIQWIGILYFLSFGANLVNNILVFLKIRSAINLPSSVFGIAAIIILGHVYANALPKASRIIRAITLSCAAFAVFNLLMLQGISFNSYSYTLNAFLILGYAVFYFYSLMKELPAAEIQRVPMFWFNTAFLLNHAGAVVLFIFKNYLDETSWEVLAVFWIFHNSLSIIHMLLILIGLRYASRQIDLPQNRVA